ncbi:MAG TPA: amidohydrolase family protein [Vicinamibacterales bacterium]
MRRAIIFLAFVLLVADVAFQPSSAQAPAAGGVTALANARVIDGTGRTPLEQATILISGGKITAVGAGSSVQVPLGATRVDMSGKTIVPGFINVHGHVQKGSENNLSVRDDLIRRLRLYASYGVTTVVSLDQLPADERDAIRLRDEQSTAAPDRTRIYTTGGSVRRLRTAQEARSAVDRLADLKVDLVKMHYDGPPDGISVETGNAIIDQAHRRGLRVAAHIFYLQEAKDALAGGVDIIAHSVRDRDVDQAFIAEMRRRDIGYVPTLTREVSVFVYESTPAFFMEPFFQRGISVYGEQVPGLSNPAAQEKVRTNKAAQAIKQALVQASENLKTLQDAGVTIAMGTDSGTALNPGRWQGYFEHVELEMMVKAGLTPMQALVAATGNAATVAKLDHVGMIAAGKAADLLVLDANPLQDIRNTRRISSVWIAGRRVQTLGTN